MVFKVLRTAHVPYCLCILLTICHQHSVNIVLTYRIDYDTVEVCNKIFVTFLLMLDLPELR